MTLNVCSFQRLCTLISFVGGLGSCSGEALDCNMGAFIGEAFKASWMQDFRFRFYELVVFWIPVSWPVLRTDAGLLGLPARALLRCAYLLVPAASTAYSDSARFRTCFGVFCPWARKTASDPDLLNLLFHSSVSGTRRD